METTAPADAGPDGPPGDPLALVSDGESAAALLHPTRLRVLRALATPDTAAGLARRLGEPRQRLGHHLRALEAVGLVRLVEERRKGNVTERVLQASARAYVVDPEVLGPVTAEPADLRRGLPTSYLVAVLSRGVRELGRLRRLAAGAGKRLPVLTLDTEVTFAGPAAQAAFAEDLARSVSAVVARHGAQGQAEGARTFRVIVGAYPLPPADPPPAPPAAHTPTVPVSRPDRPPTGSHDVEEDV
jgi:DNA-binding transcriptional ArsR family regulator